MEPFIPIFLIVFGIPFFIMYLVIYMGLTTEEDKWAWITMTLFLFQTAWVIAGQYTSHMHCVFYAFNKCKQNVLESV